MGTSGWSRTYLCTTSISLGQNKWQIKMHTRSRCICLQENCGHKARLKAISGVRMKAVWVKAAKFIFRREKSVMAYHVKRSSTWKWLISPTLRMKKKYCGGFVFVPSTASSFGQNGWKTSTADSGHCLGVGA